MKNSSVSYPWSNAPIIGALLTIKIVGALFATLVFARFSPLIDADLYLRGFYVADVHLRTRIINVLAVSLSGIGGELFAHVIFGCISSAGLIYYFINGGKRWMLALTLLLPSSIIWTSIVGKEAIFFGGFTLVLVVWTRYVAGVFNRKDLIAGLFAFGVCALLRPHYAVVLVWLFFSVTLIKKFGDKALPILMAGIVIACFAVYVVIWSELLRRGFSAIEPSARASRFQLFGIDPGTLEGLEQFKQWVPLGFIVGIVGPLPAEVMRRPEFAPFFIEGIFILLFPFFLFRYANQRITKGQKLFSRIYIWCLMPAIVALMAIHAPFGILNPGSATRWRTNFEAIFYMTPLWLFFYFIDDDRHENSTLSS